SPPSPRRSSSRAVGIFWSAAWRGAWPALWWRCASMHTTPEAVIAILGMALVTIAVKASGLLLADRLPREGFAAAWLRHIPGAVLAALVAPALVTGSPAEVVAAIATGGIFILTRNLFAAMATGVVTVYLV